MPVKTDFTVEGARQYAKAARKAGDKGSLDALKAAYRQAADLVVARALPNVPVVTGRLQATVRALASQSSGRGAAGGKSGIKYGPAVHWGTGPREGLRGPHNIARHAFLWDALQTVRAEIPDVFWDAVEKYQLHIVREEGRAL